MFMGKKFKGGAGMISKLRLVKPFEKEPSRSNICPECGEAAVVNEEGCRKCYACSYSEC